MATERPTPPPQPPRELLESWDLIPDGPPHQGFMASAWPVRDRAGAPCILKITDAHHPATGEAAALAAWADSPAAHRVVALRRSAGHALLLDRLDAARPLETVRDAGTVDDVLAQSLALLRGVPAPDTVRSTVDELARILDAVQASVSRHGSDLPVPQRQVAAALTTLRAVTRDPRRRADRELVHRDLHPENVLRDLGDTRWVVIDPLPLAGTREIEVVAPLRNRWQDAHATGDPDRALSRRLEKLADAAGLDLDLARALAQAIAVDNLLWLLPGEPADRFVDPYRVLAAWC